MEKISVYDSVFMEKLQSKLISKGFESIILNSDKEVKDFINTNIPDKCIVGLGDSITTCNLKVRNILETKGSTIFYSWDGSENYNRSLDTFETPVRPDYYLTRINAITFNGEMLMKDYSREAALNNNFPTNVFAFSGLNRVVEKFDAVESIQKYAVISSNPSSSKFTIVLLPFLSY